MGFDRKRFRCSIVAELSCPLCQNILQDPIQIPCPEEHIFCTNCLNIWLKSNKTCPVDKTTSIADNELIAPPRIVTTMLNNLDIECDFKPNGCLEVVKLGSLDDHVGMCLFDPTRPRDAGVQVDIVSEESNQLLDAVKKQLEQEQVESERLRTSIAMGSNQTLSYLEKSLSDIITLKLEKQELEKMIESKIAVIEEVTPLLDELKSTVAESTNEMFEYKKLLDDQNVKIDGLRKMLSRRDLGLKASQLEFDHLKSELAGMEKKLMALDNITSDRDRLKKDLHEMLDDFDKKCVENRDQKQQIERLNSSLNVAMLQAASFAQSKVNLDALNARFSELKLNYDRLRTQSLGDSALIKNYQTEIASKNEQIRSKELLNTALQNKLTRKDSHQITPPLHGHGHGTLAQGDDNRSVNSDGSQYDVKYEKLKKKFTVMESELKSKIKRRDERYDAIEQEHRTCLERINSFSAALEREKKSSLETEAEFAKCKSKLLKRTDQLQDAEDSIDKKKITIKELCSKVSKFQQVTAQCTRCSKDLAPEVVSQTVNQCLLDKGVITLAIQRLMDNISITDFYKFDSRLDEYAEARRIGHWLRVALKRLIIKDDVLLLDDCPYFTVCLVKYLEGGRVTTFGDDRTFKLFKQSGYANLIDSGVLYMERSPSLEAFKASGCDTKRPYDVVLTDADEVTSTIHGQLAKDGVVVNLTTGRVLDKTDVIPK